MGRCGYLDWDGKQCKRNAAVMRALHLDAEIYSFIPNPDVPPTDTRTLARWVAVPLCEPHEHAFGGTRVKNGRTVDG